MSKEKVKNFYMYLNDLFSAENLACLFKDEVLSKAAEEDFDFTQEQLFSYLVNRVNKLDVRKLVDNYVRGLSKKQFREKNREWKKEVKDENKAIAELLKKKVTTKKELQHSIEVIKMAYEKALKRREYIEDLLKDETDKESKSLLKETVQLFDNWIKELDKIYEKKAKNLSKYMVKTIVKEANGSITEEELEAHFIELNNVKKDIIELDAQIEIENIKGNANARKEKLLKEQKRLKAEKMYYKSLAMKAAVEDDIEKKGINEGKDKRIKIINGVVAEFKKILDEEEDARAKDKAYKQMLIDEGVVED